MRNLNKCLISTVIFFFLLITGFLSITVNANGEPPTPSELFNGHDFTENYWDTNVFNNSKWANEYVRNETSWENNTWNIKWMKEGNFEMGMLSFMNKTMWDEYSGREVTYTTPAQMWWQHAYLNGSEILIASMHSAWFVYEDSDHSGTYEKGEEISPFFYMGASTDKVRETGIYSNPYTEATPLQRTVSGTKVTYTWGYNYTDIVFYVPQIDRSPGKPQDFEWGFNYTDPGTYVDGSHHIGNQSYIYYEYTLEIDTTLGEATLYQDYESSKITAMVFRDDNLTAWADASPGYKWVSTDYGLCLGTWSFIMAGQDWALTDLEVGEINATAHLDGLTEVKTTLGGAHAFDFKFSQKPQYTIENINGSAPNIHDVSYQCMNTSDSAFLELVSGMTQLVGDFGRLLVGYVVNQTNHFTHGIPFDEAYNATDPNDMAAFFLTCYPEFGLYGGGKFVHDPVFKAYFTPLEEEPAILGYPLLVLAFSITLGITIILLKKRGIKTIKT
ncbi:MAG: hypothetical protein ACFE8G_10900 [Candidatus Hermodarchaeota archaeon]